MSGKTDKIRVAREKQRRRDWIIIAALIALVVLIIGAVIYATSLGPSGSQPMTSLSGVIGPQNYDVNFSIILFRDSFTHISYGAVPVANSSSSTTPCANLPPCVYKISLYSGETYNVTIQLATSTYGVQNCPALPLRVTPIGATMSQDFQCILNYR